MAIKDKVVIITGASSGIGEATAKLLAAKGAAVMLGARRTEKLETIVNEIKQAGGRADYRVTDVRSLQALQDLVHAAVAAFGQVDVIFNNAGIMPNSPLSALHVQEWYDTIDVNLKGVFNGIAAVLPLFNAQQHGQVITTSSVAGLKSFTTGAAYGATKWGVRDLMEVLRMESAEEKTHIRTTTLYPSATATELLTQVTDGPTKTALQAHYDEATLSSEAVAQTVAYAIDQPEEVNISELTIYPTEER